MLYPLSYGRNERSVVPLSHRNSMLSRMAGGSYVVGAYPASPAHKVWNPNLEREFFSALTEDRRITTLELPWLGSIHPHDDQWLLKNFPTQWQAIITDIPFVMSQISRNPAFGIASSDETGRNEALTTLKEIADAVRRFNDAQSRKVVSTIEIHTAPRQIGSISSLTRSLDEISNLDWDGAELAIEHCDAWIDGQTPEKGFLSLSNEIQAIQNSSTPIGIFINWGRSAIELRDASRVSEHVAIANESGFLTGLIFSGASNRDGEFGPAWIDAHHPLRKDAANPFGDPDSLLTQALLRDSIAAAGSIKNLGIKMGWSPKREGTISERVSMITSALDSLDSLL